MFDYLSLQDVELVAHALARELLAWNEPIPPFATRYPEKLESCLATIRQTFGGRDLYPTLVDKAAILFYLLIKDHPFQNGNKRMAVTTLLVFLYRNDKWLRVDTQALYNFSKWVASSPPELKDATVKGVTDFINRNIQKK
jgi:death on curing protein